MIPRESGRKVTLCIKLYDMKTTEKLTYETPSTEVLEVVQGGVICASETRTDGAPYYNPFNDEEEW